MAEALVLDPQPIDPRVDLKGLLPEELQEFISALWKERYRTKQLLA